MLTHRHSFRIWKPLTAIGVAVVVWLLLASFPAEQRAVGTVFAVTIILWATEAFPVGVTALGGMVLLALFGGIGEARAFAGLGDPIIALFIGSLIIAKAMEVTGLSKRIALSMLRRPGPTKSPGRLLLAVSLLTAAASLFLSNTATVATMFPIAMSILKALGVDHPKHGYAVGMLLALTFSASVCVGTPVGTPPDLIAVEQIEQAAKIDINFLTWMGFGIPITLLMLAVVYGVLQLLFGKEQPNTAEARERCEAEAAALGPMSAAEKVTIWALAVAIFLWVVPPIVGPMLRTAMPDLSTWLDQRLSANVAGVLASVLLFAIPAKGAEGGHAITWRDAVQIDWGVILLLAGGLSLGTALFDSGLAQRLGQELADATGAKTLWSITALGLALAIVVGEFASNTATATAVLPVAIGLAESAHVSPVAPALGVALGASLGFAMPISTPTNAIVFSSGLVPQGQMIKAGVIIDIIGFFVVFGALRLLLPILGLA
ncbi:MAG: DASS family sodium-coupled anion symporter [Fimbriimonadaceae bacterium]|nr:DASS family sodium-coupled anion symporter [Fimbriimonadaceae bacterium]